MDDELIQDAAKLNENDLLQLNRPGFEIVFYDTLEEFYLAEALEYVAAWKEATPDNPVGICGPIGPTEQLPLVARLVNELELDLSAAHFWGMDEWIGEDGRAVSTAHPLSFERADRELCFDRFKKPIPEENLHFPNENVEAFASTWKGVRCKVMQGGQGDVKHWAFNDPLKREGAYLDEPPGPEEYRKLGTRIVELHPITLSQNARLQAVETFRSFGPRRNSGPGRNLASRTSLHLACRHSRQPFGSATDCIDDLQGIGRFGRPHVPACRSPEGQVQLLSRWIGRVLSRNALSQSASAVCPVGELLPTMLLYDLFDGLIIGFARSQQGHFPKLDKLLQLGQIAEPGLFEQFVRLFQVYLGRAKQEQFGTLVFGFNCFDGQDRPGLIGGPAFGQGGFYGRQADHFPGDLHEALQPPGQKQEALFIQVAQVSGIVPALVFDFQKRILVHSQVLPENVWSIHQNQSAFSGLEFFVTVQVDDLDLDPREGFAHACGGFVRPVDRDDRGALGNPIALEDERVGQPVHQLNQAVGQLFRTRDKVLEAVQLSVAPLNTPLIKVGVPHIKVMP